MNINIFGSTGIIGSKSLKILIDSYSEIKIDLLVANENYKKLLIQANLYKPKAICLKNTKKLKLIKDKIPKGIKIIYYNDLSKYLRSTKTSATLLSVSGYESIQYLEDILINTKNLGLVNKECIVSCGHLFKKIFKKYNVNLFPLDSEHFSIFNLSNNQFKLSQINKIYLTASGGPFLNHKISDLKKITFNQAIKHPKWKMGYKNSIDSATLANKCLEVVEAMYLFNFDINSIDVIIHPEALAHSIIEYKNYTSIINYFYNDMSIPLINFYN